MKSPEIAQRDAVVFAKIAKSKYFTTNTLDRFSGHEFAFCPSQCLQVVRLGSS